MMRQDRTLRIVKKPRSTRRLRYERLSALRETFLNFAVEKTGEVF